MTNNSTPLHDDNDDMSEAKAMSEAQGYHQRSPSMMIVVPLLEDNDEMMLVCDDLNASYYDFFQDNAKQDTRSALVESPRSVVPNILGTPSHLGKGNQTIPALTDLMKATTLSKMATRKNRRSRNRAMSATEFEQTILPNINEGQIEKSKFTSPLLEDLTVPPLCHPLR